MLKNNNPYISNHKAESDALVLQYMPALRAMAFRLKERLPSSIDVNDLISMGAEEMIKLSRKYDEEQNDSFWGFAKKRVYGSMLDYLRSLDVLSRSERTLVKAIESEVAKYMIENDDEPSDEYLAQTLNEPLEKIKEAKAVQDITSVLSLNEQIALYDQKSIEDTVEQDDLIQKVMDALKHFSQREQLIIQLYYFEELNLKEISEILEITESRISQIHKKLLQKIREAL